MTISMCIPQKLVYPLSGGWIYYHWNFLFLYITGWASNGSKQHMYPCRSTADCAGFPEGHHCTLTSHIPRPPDPSIVRYESIPTGNHCCWMNELIAKEAALSMITPALHNNSHQWYLCHPNVLRPPIPKYFHKMLFFSILLRVCIPANWRWLFMCPMQPTVLKSLCCRKLR